MRTDQNTNLITTPLSYPQHAHSMNIQNEPEVNVSPYISMFCLAFVRTEILDTLRCLLCEVETKGI